MRNSLHDRKTRTAIRRYQKQVTRFIRTAKRWSVKFKAAVICAGLLLFTSLARWSFGSANLQPDFNVHATLSDGFRNTYDSLVPKDTKARQSIEKELTFQHICERRDIHQLKHLRFCGEFPIKSDHKKIIALVEVRNVELTIDAFLSAIRQVVDSVVIIDDHSVDGSRNRILSYNSRLRENDRRNKPLVEILLNKTGSWLREELLDRQLLLDAGREIGGTHFVLLDYDEYLSSNCVRDGTIRSEILNLNPGESLFIPWTEAWKSLAKQRVLPNDLEMNFLRRRQTVIFADDGKAMYTDENSLSRHLGSSSNGRNSTIHVVRCPRSICPQPPRYHGPGTGHQVSQNVKTLPHCRIIELRFLNLHNVFLKSAWYEALGRVTGAADGSTSGKMITSLFGHANDDKSDTTANELHFPEPDTVSTIPLDKKWVESYDGLQELYQKVELWRADELFEWIQQHGKSHFSNLIVLDQLNIDALRNAADTVRKTRERSLTLVPRRTTGTLILVFDDLAAPLIHDFLTALKWDECSLSSSFSDTFPGDEHDEKYENRRAAIETAVQAVLEQSSTNSAFLSMSKVPENVVVNFIRFCNSELPYIRVVALFSTWKPDKVHRQLYFKTASMSLVPGNNLHVIDIPMQQFGSYSVVIWIAKRLSQLTPSKTFTETDYDALLSYSEQVQRKYQNDASSMGIPLSPVAHLIFSLNVGRSGSKYLADMISTANGPVKAIHEPRCPKKACSGGGAMRMQDQPLSESYEERKKVKLPMITQELLSIAMEKPASTLVSSSLHDCETDYTFFSRDIPNDIERSSYAQYLPILETHFGSERMCRKHIPDDVIYAETNPNFKAWEFDVVLDNLPDAGYVLSVIVIRKYVASALKSLYETGFFGTRDGYTWMETSAGINSRVKVSILQDDQALSTHERLLSYILNAEAVFRDVERQYKEKRVRFIHMRSENMYSKQGTMWLLRKLGIRAGSETMQKAGLKRDKYIEGGKRRYGHISLDQCESLVKDFIQKVGRIDSDVVRLFDEMNKVDNFDYPT